jgi:hypothetical protein
VLFSSPSRELQPQPLSFSFHHPNNILLRAKIMELFNMTFYKYYRVNSIQALIDTNEISGINRDVTCEMA